MSRFVPLPCLIGAWLSFGALGCQKQAPTGPAAAEQTEQAPAVHVQPVQSESLTPVAAGTAELHAEREAMLAAEAAGRVVWVGFDAGSRVEKGALLLRVDLGRVDAQLRAAESTTSQAEAQLLRAQRERELAERLVQQGSMPQQELERAADAERIAEASVQSARAQAGVSRRGLTEAELRAPFAGVIRERLVERGEFVTPGKPVAMLVDPAGLKATVLLDPRKALDVSVGADAELQAFARPNETFRGRVTRVADSIDTRTRKLPVELAVDDPNHRLRPGLVGRFEVQVGPPRDALLVDQSAVFERFGEQHVYVVQDGTARRRAVTLGATHQGRVEVISGLTAGEQVIVRGVDRVVDGHPVRVVEAPVAEARP